MLNFIRNRVFLAEIGRLIDCLVSTVTVTAMVESGLGGRDLCLKALREYLLLRDVDDDEMEARISGTARRYDSLAAEFFSHLEQNDWREVYLVLQCFLADIYEPRILPKDRAILAKIYSICDRKLRDADIFRFRGLAT